MIWANIVTIARAGYYSVRGIGKAIKRERPFQQELFFFVPGTVLAAFMARDILEFSLLVFPFLIALSLELVNSAVESVVDRVGLERDKLAEDAKDFASAAVFIANMTAFTIWAVYLVKRFL
ncbi:MAG: diacylglycerol kinase [Magnetospiraceae bacterium]